MIKEYSKYCFDVAIIGGGLTGILAAIRLIKEGVKVALIDNPLPLANGKIGGFARFSGAKFSLPPAGMGLVPVAGSIERLMVTINKVTEILGLKTKKPDLSKNRFFTSDPRVMIRCYESVVLNPSEINKMLKDLSQRLTCTTLIRGCATALLNNDERWLIEISIPATREKFVVAANVIFYAAGRLSDDILVRAGAIPNEGKGLDIGVRLEFLDKSAVSNIRQYAPDAKIMYDRCRTFCLNSPGTIYRYPFKGIMIPGGIAANTSVLNANLGVLLRVSRKSNRLSEIITKALPLSDKIERDSLKLRSRIPFSLPRCLYEIFGEDDAKKLDEFCQLLYQINLLDLNQEYRIHIPLLDWHWNTFAQPNSHKTNLDNVYALGDSAGHARGLLQAAVSGWLAAEEFLC